MAAGGPSACHSHRWLAHRWLDVSAVVPKGRREEPVGEWCEERREEQSEGGAGYRCEEWREQAGWADSGGGAMPEDVPAGLHAREKLAELRGDDLLAKGAVTKSVS